MNERGIRNAAERGETTPLSFAGWIRLTIRLLVLIVLLMAFVPLHYLYRIFRDRSPVPMLFLRYSGKVCGAKVRKIGEPLRRDVLFVSNHISWLDILSLAGASGTAFVARDLRHVPLVGWLAGLNRTVYVDRNNRLGIAKQIDDLRDALRDGGAIAIFPEGATGDGQLLLPFKTSMLSVLEPPPPGIRVQPVFMDYGAVGVELGWVGDESGLNNVKRVLGRKGTFVIDMHFLEPFSPRDYRGRKAIGARAEAAIEAALSIARGGSRKQVIGA